VADRLGFEPKTALRLYSISSAAPSTGLGHLSVSEKSTGALLPEPTHQSGTEAKLTPDSKLVLRLGSHDGSMNKNFALLFGSGIAAAMAVGIVVGASGLVKSPLTAANAAFAAASPAPTFKSNETAAHEKSESAAREAAENSGTAFGPRNGHSNETSAHEAGESAAREAAENAGTPPPATP
jgi:hypothetical protein